MMFKFSNNWNQTVRGFWDEILGNFDISKVLEIGSYEGQSACYLAEKMHYGDIHCIDNWVGCDELKNRNINFVEVEDKFDYNINLAKHKNKLINFYKYKKQSYIQLSKFISQGKENYFDLIYVDGAHDSQNVIMDAILSYKLVKQDGIIIFDDYLRKTKDKNLLKSPKFAIDSFVNIFYDKLYIIRHTLNQLYVIKTDKLD